MANEQNLTPFNTMTVEQQRVLQSKGGSVRSDKKKFAAKLREMKKRGLESADIKWFLAKLQDRESYSFDLILWLDKMRAEIPLSRQRTLLDTAVAIAKFTHGERIETKNTNININVALTSFQGMADDYE